MLHRIEFKSMLALFCLFIFAGCSGASSPAQAATSLAQSATGAQPSASAPEPFRHTVRAGESIPSIVRQYISRTSFMTAPELEAALRVTNGIPQGSRLKPRQELFIPGYETASIVERPVPVAKDFEARAIYLTGAMASSDRGIRLIRKWHELGGNSVVFDIKDSDGSINIAFDHPLAPKAKHHSIANLPKLIRYLHSLNMHAIARIALFRDEHIARDYPALAVQSRRAVETEKDKSVPQPWLENGKQVWTDPSNLEVQDYDLALAKFVAQSGADEIQFDYVRFPAEGDQKDALFKFMTRHPEGKNLTRADVIAAFLDRAYGELHPSGVLVSLDVFGIMAWQRTVDLSHTGQDIVRMAKYCDVLSPMIYPSHFFGMDGYKHPGDAPEHFISTSMQRFEKITLGSGVVLRPWLQAFAWRTKTYSPQYIETQVRVARANGGIGFLFWNARNDYGRPFAAMPVMRAQADEYFQTTKPVKLAGSPASTLLPAPHESQPAKGAAPAITPASSTTAVSPSGKQ